MVELADGAAGNPFVCDAATADVCVMAGGTVVQAHAQVWRMLKRPPERPRGLRVLFVGGRGGVARLDPLLSSVGGKLPDGVLIFVYKLQRWIRPACEYPDPGGLSCCIYTLTLFPV